MKKEKRHIKEYFHIQTRRKQLKKEMDMLPLLVMSMVKNMPTRAEKIYEE